MKHMMVDLETLDTRPSTVILSIGAVVFDPDEDRQDSWHWRLSWQTQLDIGRTVSESTLRWWLKQDNEARAALAAGEKVDLPHALSHLRSVYEGGHCERIWARGTTFDISILENAYLQCGHAIPWKYNAPRDMRIFDDLFPPDFFTTVPQGVAHNAVDDAVYQARVVVKALRWLPRPVA